MLPSSTRPPSHRQIGASHLPGPRVRGWQNPDVAEDGINYVTSTPVTFSLPTTAPHQPQPHEMMKRTSAPDMGHCNDADFANKYAFTDTRPQSKRPRTHYSTNLNENAGALAAATFDPQGALLSAHGPGFVVGAPPLHAYGTIAASQARPPRGHPSLRGREVLSSRGVTHRTAAGYPTLVAQGSTESSFTYGSNGGFQPGLVPYAPFEPNIPVPAAGPSHMVDNHGSFSHTTYTEQPLRRMARTQLPSPETTETQPFGSNLEFYMDPGFQLPQTFHEPVQTPMISPHSTLTTALQPVGSDFNSMAPATRPALALDCIAAPPAQDLRVQNDVLPVITQNSMGVGEAVTDDKAHLTRSFLNEIAPMVAQYGDEKYPKDFWELVVAFVSITNGGLSPELSEVVEKCRKKNCTSG